MAHDEPEKTNTQQARARDAIYLTPSPNTQGGHVVLDITTNQVITRGVVTPVPITPSVIAAVEALAQKDGMSGLRVKSYTGEVLYDSSWIAGVDYAHQDDDEDDDDDESYRSDEDQDSDEEEDEEEYDSESDTDTDDDDEEQELSLIHI